MSERSEEADYFAIKHEYEKWDVEEKEQLLPLNVHS